MKCVSEILKLFLTVSLEWQGEWEFRANLGLVKHAFLAVEVVCSFYIFALACDANLKQSCHYIWILWCVHATDCVRSVWTYKYAPFLPKGGLKISSGELCSYIPHSMSGRAPSEWVWEWNSNVIFSYNNCFLIGSLSSWGILTLGTNFLFKYNKCQLQIFHVGDDSSINRLK